MVSECCGNCWFHNKGVCQRFPPVMVGAEAFNEYGAKQVFVEAHLVHVDADHWCGEWADADVISKKRKRGR